jgi:hypothetical protein
LCVRSISFSTSIWILARFPVKIAANKYANIYLYEEPVA